MGMKFIWPQVPTSFKTLDDANKYLKTFIDQLSIYENFLSAHIHKGTPGDFGVVASNGTELFKVVYVSTSVTAGQSATYLCDATAGNITITLPTATPAISGRLYNIKKVDASANTVIIAPTTSTIDGLASKTITVQWNNICVVTDGNQWYIV